MHHPSVLQGNERQQKTNLIYADVMIPLQYPTTMPAIETEPQVARRRSSLPIPTTVSFRRVPRQPCDEFGTRMDMELLSLGLKKLRTSKRNLSDQ